MKKPTKKQERMLELFDEIIWLETLADRLYCENIDWSERFKALCKEDQKEYKRVYKEYYGVNFKS